MLETKIKDNKIFAPLKDKYLILTPEEQVRQDYICRLVNSYGYLLEQMDQEVVLTNTKRGTGQARADIVIWKSKEDKQNNKSAFIIIECKAEYITIREEDYFQGSNYASFSGADFFVTTNMKETRIFRVKKGEIPKNLDEIIDIPKAEDLSNTKKLKEILSQTKEFTRDEFSKLLFKCHNIIRNNDKLSPEAAFDEISKILFIKIRYERNNTGSQIFSLDEFQKLKEAYKSFASDNSLPFYQNLFENTKKDFAKDDLFESNETLRIKEGSFEDIVKELQIYNLSRTSDDVKGIAFEKFLGKTFRGELGQFFTPRTIVDFMVEILDPQEGEVVCDPCCGSGGFLIKVFEYVREKIEKDIQIEKENIKKIFFNDDYLKTTDKEKQKIEDKVNVYFAQLNDELDTSREESRLKKLSYNSIYGTDANPRMARTAKMNMIMHGDGHGGVHHHDGLINVNGIFENRFDVILTNPPFGSRVDKNFKISEEDLFSDEEKIKHYIERYGEEYTKAINQVKNNIGKSLLGMFECGKLSGLTEVLFIERCFKLLKPGGRLGIVLPDGVLNTSSLQNVRELFESKAKIILITSIPQDVFIASGATVKPSLIFFKKFTLEEEKEYKNAKKKAKDKDEIKQLFDYKIPYAKVDKAGITTTGGECENELIDLIKEYTPYRKENKLWDETSIKYTYEIVDDKLFRNEVIG